MKHDITIAHIADLHISREHNRANLRRIRRLLDATCRHGVDHVVVTGDISADADRRELETARRLFESTGMLKADRLTVTLGNHDIFGGVHKAEDILAFPKRCRETDFPAMVSTFNSVFSETYEGCLHADKEHPYPFAKVLGNVVLVGINTVAHYSRLTNPVGSNGDVRDGQFERIKTLLGHPEIRKKRKIVLSHHHFNKLGAEEAGTLTSVWSAIERQTMKLRGKRRLFDLFREHEVALVLHGHVHRNLVYERRGTRFVNGGGAILGPAEKTMFNLVRIGARDVEVRAVEISDGRLPADVRHVPLKAPALVAA